MTWNQFLARDLVWPYTYRAPKPTDDEGEVSFADYIGDEVDGGWTPEVPSVLDEKPPRVPIIPDPPRPTEYRDQQHWDELAASKRAESEQWRDHAADLAMWRNDLEKTRKRRNQRVTKLRKEYAARTAPQVTP